MIEKLRGLRLTKAAELVETATEKTLTYYAFPEKHWRTIRTTDEIDKVAALGSGVDIPGPFVDGDADLDGIL